MHEYHATPQRLEALSSGVSMLEYDHFQNLHTGMFSYFIIEQLFLAFVFDCLRSSLPARGQRISI